MLLQVAVFKLSITLYNAEVPNPYRKERKKETKTREKPKHYIQTVPFTQKNPRHESSYPPQNAIISVSKHSSCLLS